MLAAISRTAPAHVHSRHAAPGQRLSPAPHHRLRLRDRDDLVRAALGDGPVPGADAGGDRLVAHPVRPGHGNPEPVLGARPALLRGGGRQVRRLAHAGAGRRGLCDRAPDDVVAGRHRLPACGRRSAGRAWRRGLVVRHRAVGLRAQRLGREPLDGVRPGHRGRVARHVPVRAALGGAHRPLRLVGRAGLAGRDGAGDPAAGDPAARQRARRDGPARSRCSRRSPRRCRRRSAT